MKKELTLFMCLCFWLTHSTAQKHDNTWVLGYPGNGAKFGHTLLTFTDGTLKMDTNSIMNDYEFPQNNSAISDGDGALKCFFNGEQVRNSMFENMENGADIVQDIIPFIYTTSELTIPQGSIFLPYPGHPDSCILLFNSQLWIVSPLGGVIDRATYDLSALVINLKANAGQGRVEGDIQNIIHMDTMYLGGISAVRHANGRDWWMFRHKWNSNQYHRVLIDPWGVHDTGLFETSQVVKNGSPGFAFTPNGEKCILFSGVTFEADGSQIYIFDFDRCTGLLSNPVHIIKVGKYAGVAISPESRFAYVNRLDTCFQYDIQAANIPSSEKVVAVYDGFTDPLYATFYMMASAPDGKIYASATNGTRYLHVIHRPDEEGPACQYQQHGLQLIKYNSFTVPNFPNYRLGPLDGSPCDTLGLNNNPQAWFRCEADTLNPLFVSFRDLSYYEPVVWHWDFGDGSAASAERHPEHTYDTAGVYQVCLTVSNGFGSDTYCKTLYLGVSALDNPELQNQIIITPNPFDDHLAVLLSSRLRGAVFRLYDVTGRRVLEAPLEYGGNEINTQALTSGTYFCEVIARGEKIKVGKVIKAGK